MSNNNETIIVVETENFIKFIKDDKNKCYKIPKETLGDAILIHGVVYSKWINKLKDKSWCTKDSLYRLAVIIKRAFPTNIIDWNLQFFMIECESHNIKKFSEIRELFDEEHGFMNRLFIEKDNLNFSNKTILEVERNFEHFTIMSSDKSAYE